MGDKFVQDENSGIPTEGGKTLCFVGNKTFPPPRLHSHLTLCSLICERLRYVGAQAPEKHSDLPPPGIPLDEKKYWNRVQTIWRAFSSWTCSSSSLG